MPLARVEKPSPATNPRSAIVTGGASGIGRALAEELAAAGVRVVVADRQAELADTVASGIRARGGAATAAALDVRDPDRFRAVVQATIADAGRLDYLFNNAGIGVLAAMRDYEQADWDDVFDVNLRGVAHGIAAAYPAMIRQGFGHIVNTASMAGLIATPLLGSYSASKYAVVGLSRALRLEARRHGVRVSVVCPGLVRTPIFQGGRYGRVKIDPARHAAFAERAGPLAMDPSRFARRVLRAVERNRGVIIVPAWARLFWYLDRLAPWVGDKLAASLLGRLTSDD